MKQPFRANYRLPWRSIAIITMAIFVWATLLCGAESGGVTVVENFERYGEGKFPDRWQVKRSEARTIYRVAVANGSHFLRAHADKQSAHIALEHSFDPKLQQLLSWRWRVHALPHGADERDAEKHDAAAQVYVIFDNLYWPRVIKYIWSAALPSGTRFTNPLYSRGRIVVLCTGAQEKDKWYQETVNFYEDYKSLFGAEPGTVQGLGILSSSDATKTLVIADYDQFVLLP